MKRAFQVALRGAMSALLLAGTTPLLEPPAFADPPANAAKDAPAGRTQVRVQVVLANNSGKVDPALRSLEAQFKFTKYTGFDLLSQSTEVLAVGGDTSFPVEGGRRLRVDLLERTPTQAKVRIRLVDAGNNVLDTTVSIPRNSTVTIGGPKYNGGALILPVTVSY